MTNQTTDHRFRSRDENLRLYLAGPLFSAAEREFNKNLKSMLSPFFSVYLPQEDGGLMVEMIEKGMHPQRAAQCVFTMDVNAIDECDVLLIILDGRAVDEGASFELGFAFARGKECFGLRTDPRQLLATGNNPMIESPLRHIFEDVDSLISWAKEYGLRDVPLSAPSNAKEILTVSSVNAR